ncbi:hypothetical protein ACN28E_35525 [Archangium lansingense]|uniref:hypothetical protein n=1 Tax=Archangium lansingense TaxID=2995310 RepID=UPI003B821BAF
MSGTLAQAQGEQFLDVLWDSARNIETRPGVAVEVIAHGEWLGLEAKAGIKATYYPLSLVELSVDGAVGLGGGFDLPNWFPVSAYGHLGASIGGAMVVAFDLETGEARLKPRIKFSLPSICLGGRPVPLLEIECTHLNLFYDPEDSQISMYFTLGAGLPLPFLPDLGKLLVQISPKLRAKGELHGIARFDMDSSMLEQNLKQLMA